MKIHRQQINSHSIIGKTALTFTAIFFPLIALAQLVKNPLTTQFFLDLLTMILKAAAAVAGAAAVIAILAAAFMYLTSSGNLETIKRARKVISYSIAVMVIMLFLQSLPIWIRDFFGEEQEEQIVVETPPPPPTPPPTTPPPPPPPPPPITPICNNCTRVITQNVQVSPRACCTTTVTSGTCQQFDSLLNCQVSNTHAQQLASLSQLVTPTTWRVTEAWPPTVVHQNPCHLRATCTDANFVNPSVNATPNNISNFIRQAISSGITPIYEVTTQSRKDSLVASGVPTNNIQIVPGINSEHFSLYSCSNFQSGC